MACMLNLGDIFQLVIDGLNNGSLTQHQLIEDGHQLVFHVLANLGYNLYIIIEQKVKQGLRDITFVSEELPKQSFSHGRQHGPIGQSHRPQS